MRSQGLLKPGTVFGRDYQVVSRLASGGMGTVYVAEQMSTGKRRALKVLHPQYVTDTRTRERFAQEARVGASIESDHVVEVVAAGVDEETDMPWIAMELLVGQNLAKIASQRAPIAPTEVMEIFRQLCHALAAAHRAGIIHRDLKPENIFLAEARRAGVPFTVKILDFGIAKFIHENTTSLTQAMGSPRWMAPEQSQRGGDICAATDVWALGLIAFQLLTGKYYWKSANTEHPSAMTLLYELMTEPIDPPSQRVRELGADVALPPGFDDWFLHSVARDLEDRYQDAGEAMDALLPVLSIERREARSILPPRGRQEPEPEPEDDEVEELDRNQKPLPLTHTRSHTGRPGVVAAVAPVEATPHPSNRPAGTASGPVSVKTPNPGATPDHSGHHRVGRTPTPATPTRTGPAPAGTTTGPVPTTDATPAAKPADDAFVLGDTMSAPLPPTPLRERPHPQVNLPLMLGLGAAVLLAVIGAIAMGLKGRGDPGSRASIDASTAPRVPPPAPDVPRVIPESVGADTGVAALPTHTPDTSVVATVTAVDSAVTGSVPLVQGGPTNPGGTTRTGRGTPAARGARTADGGATPTPATQDGIIDTERVSAAIRGEMSSFRECYSRGTREHPGVAGRLELVFTIGPTGRASSVSTRGLDEAPEVGTCVAGVVRGMSFPPSSDGNAVFSYPLTFRAATPPPDPTPPPAPTPEQTPETPSP